VNHISAAADITNRLSEKMRWTSEQFHWKTEIGWLQIEVEPSAKTISIDNSDSDFLLSILSTSNL